jgi:hypothetical protein
MILNPVIAGTRWTAEVIVEQYKSEAAFIEAHMADEGTYSLMDADTKKRTLYLAWQGAIANLVENGIIPAPVAETPKAKKNTLSTSAETELKVSE